MCCAVCALNSNPQQPGPAAIAQSLHVHLRTFRNPHLARLQLRPGLLDKRTTWLSCVNLMLLVNAWLLGATVILEEWGMGMATVAFYSAAIPLMLVVPVLTAVVTVNLVTVDVSQQPFELLKTTTLSDWALVSGYLYAIVLKLRTIYTVVLGAWLAITLTTLFSLVLLNAFNNTTIFNIRYFMLMLTLLVQNTGLIALMLAGTVALALRMPTSRAALTILMPMAAFALSVGLPLATYLLLPAPGAADTAGLRVAAAVRYPLQEIITAPYIPLMALPWMVAGVSVWSAVRGVRRV